METVLRAALWRQFSTAVDAFENALLACPPALWTQRLWPAPPPPWFPPVFSEFWFVCYHTIFWFDLYVTGRSEEEFTPPAPFIWTEIDPPVAPEHPYTQEELHAYLAATRRKCHDTLAALTDAQASRIVEYPWSDGKAVSYLELLMYNMRHVQEHAAQLSLFLGQQGIEVPYAPTRALEDAAFS